MGSMFNSDLPRANFSQSSALEYLKIKSLKEITKLLKKTKFKSIFGLSGFINK